MILKSQTAATSEARFVLNGIFRFVLIGKGNSLATSSIRNMTTRASRAMQHFSSHLAFVGCFSIRTSLLVGVLGA
jgi:hypothetical protein